MDQFEWLRRLQANVRWIEELQRKLLPSKAILDGIERDRRLYTSLNGMVLHDITRHLEQEKQLRSLIAGFTVGPVAAKLALNEQTQWAKLLTQLKVDGINATQFSAAAFPSAVWASNLDKILASFQSVQLPNLYPGLTDRLLAPYTGYSQFSRRTVARLRKTSDAEAAGALSAALVLAEEQVVEAADLLTDTVEESDEELIENDGLMVPVKPRLLEVQRQELLLAREIPEDADVSLLVSLAPSADLAARAREVVNAIVRCNRQARSLGDDNVFKPTTTFMEAQNNLGWIAVVNKQSLGDFVDCLYLMLYEGAGKDKLRFLEYIGKEHCEVIWTIKHLRNKWLRHDPDHGQSSDIKKSHAALRAALSTLGLGRQPRVKEDFAKLHRSLLDQVTDLLNRLEDALGARGDA